MPLSWDPPRLSSELLKAQWRWPVCGSSPSRLPALAGFQRPSFSAPHCASYRLARSLAIPSTARFFPLCHVSLPQFRRKSRRAGWFRELCLTHATSAKKQNSILKNKDGGAPYKPRINHEGHKATRRKQELPSCNFVSFVV